ncbi:MAG TPA: UvrD-helicase domain-containing protein [Thermoleophilaceae bacterium]|nr:UvrD-helicase domain-containing protein [Thermoleophilaceae bacterium]
MKATPQQQRAVERRDGPLFVHAGAGSGKTSVLVERFVRAARDDEAGIDSVLAITFTDKAAAEMKLRIRARLSELGERDLARETERAWVSTIHGFCSRVLRAHPLAAGIDPEYRVLDEGEAARLALHASEQAMEGFLGGDPQPDRLELIAAYGPDRLGQLVREFHARRRAAGETEPRLPVPDDDRDQREIACCRLLAELVERFGARYAEAKRRRSALDFEDLELLTRNLLAGSAGLRERYRARFAHVLVDELQDVNPLQEQLLELIAGQDESLPPHLFTVGDEMQSIYGFRHADVGVFQRRRAEAARANRIESLTVNFRSRAEILDVIDAGFSDVFGDAFQPLDAPDDAERTDEPRVELLMVDKSRPRWKETLGDDPFRAGDVPEWRAAEARLLAKRIQALAEAERRSYGDFVILLRALSDAPLYERALRDRGVPTYLAGGGGYWGQQQVADVRSYLAAVANPLDEVALMAALASPLGDVSLDAIVALGLAAKRSKRPLWDKLLAVVEEAPAAGAPAAGAPVGVSLAPRDRVRIRAFVDRLERDRGDAPRIALEDLLDRAVTDSGYDRAVLQMPDGERRMANLRKLMRVARSFEDEEGRDLRRFIDFLDEQRLIRPREGEATLEGAELGAVRLMTIHNAKGLEFPVVCVADLGREGREDDALLDLAADGRIGLRIATLEDGLVDSRDRAELREARRDADDLEERRVMYVALTRAEERLIVSGATDFEKWPQPTPLGAPANWLWRVLAPDMAERVVDGEVGGESTREWHGRTARVAWTACAPATVDAVLSPEDRAPEPLRDPADAQHMLALAPHFDPVAAPSPLPVSRLSYSALASYARCGYRFHLERVAGLHATEEVAPGADEFGADISALARGTVVHELLEHMDMTTGGVADDERIAAVIESNGGRASVDAVGDVRGMLRGFASSPMRERLGRAAGVRTEVPFAFNLRTSERSLLITGYLDVLAVESDRTLVLDYKTDALEGRDPAAVCDERYGGQRTVYALAALRSGAERVEVAYSFLERPDEVVSSAFTAADKPALEARLGELAAGLVAGRFEPSPAPGADLCAGCPGRAALCSWPPERTFA